MHTSTVISFVLFVTAIYGGDIELCPPNLNRSNYLRTHQSYCYEFIIHKHVPWQSAVNECRKKGGNLVVINNIDEQNFLMTSLRSFPFKGQGLWIGLSDKDAEGTYKWVTGDPLDFTYWARGQPGGHKLISGKRFIVQLPDEDCILMKYTDSGHWHDYDCNKLDLLGLVPANFPYICQYAQTVKTSEISQTLTVTKVTTIETLEPYISTSAETTRHARVTTMQTPITTTALYRTNEPTSITATKLSTVTKQEITNTTTTTTTKDVTTTETPPITTTTRTTITAAPTTSSALPYINTTSSDTTKTTFTRKLPNTTYTTAETVATAPSTTNNKTTSKTTLFLPATTPAKTTTTQSNVGVLVIG